MAISYRILQSIQMLFKIVLDKQIRVFDCKETPSIKLIYAFISKTFPKIRSFTVYYFDQDNDQIALENDSDLNIFLTNANLKPKIFINVIQQQAFENTVKIQIDAKEQKQQTKATQKIQQKQIRLPKKQLAEKQQQLEKVEKKSQQVHPVKCDLCEESPILGTRFNCSVCKSFDLCQKCEQLQKHQHPLIKIRFNEQAPISCKIEFNQARASLFAEKLKQTQLKQKQKIVYQTSTERQQIVISYLGNLLGEDEFLRYKQFSKICRSQNYEDIVEEYLSWTQKNETNFHKITNWIWKYLSKIKQQFE